MKRDTYFVKIFKFSLNIFKRYRNNDTPCVIIEDVEKYVVFGKYRLPLEIRKKYYQQIEQRQAEYSDSDLISIASVRLKSLMISTLREAELTGIKTQGYFTEEGYKITSDVSALVNIGEERFFSK